MIFIGNFIFIIIISFDTSMYVYDNYASLLEIVVPKTFAEMAAVVVEFLDRSKASKVFPTC